MFYVHMLLLLAVIFVGIRYGGIAFGLLGGLGVSILSFFFGIAPGQPPIGVMLIILAVVAASATLEATGGLKLLVKYAEILLRKHPSKVVFLGLYVLLPHRFGGYGTFRLSTTSGYL